MGAHGRAWITSSACGLPRPRRDPPLQLDGQVVQTYGQRGKQDDRRERLRGAALPGVRLQQEPEALRR